MTFKTLAQAMNTRAVARNTPISQAVTGREAEMTQVGNGFVFKLDNWLKLDRFLILGTESTMYKAGASADLNRHNADLAKELISQNGNQVVDRCVQISQAGRAKNNDYALLVMALAMTHGSNNVKRYAGASLPLVARTGTHLMHFVGFANGMRGWGKSLKKAVSDWYATKTPEQVAYQAVKYQQRDGWSQRDILRLAHPKAGEDTVRNNVYKYIVKGAAGMTPGDMISPIIIAFEEAKTANKSRLVQLILEHRLSHEMIPNEMKNSPEVWEALAQHMGSTALLRNLNKLTSVGLIAPYSEFSKSVANKLTDVTMLHKDRVHPLTVLIAKKQYAQGKGDKGSLIWKPDAAINVALEGSFYASFAAIEPSCKNLMLALDVSGSMDGVALGVPITCREGATVMAMVTARTEKNSAIFGFDHKFRDLGITALDTLEAACKKTYSRNFGSTDCGLPMKFAQEQKWDIDCFSVYTDNETNHGVNHPFQSLRNYRNAMGKPTARLVAVGMTVNDVSIADPKDAGMLDVAGFDSQVPQFISNFAAGRI
jgi:60 kDa SS-A/Ro ribonucleoprotein